MSYFLNDKIYSQLKFKDLLNDNDILEIEVVNNETISFDFRGVQLPCDQQDVVTEIIKIVIHWGDGKIDKLTRPFAKQKTSIVIREDQEWKIVQHLFNVDKKYFYTNDKHKITIDFYNTFGECKTYVIYYKMFYKSIYDIGSDFSLLSANLTNDNNVSYTLRQDNTDSVIVTSNKKIKLNEIIGDVQYKEVSFDQVDDTPIQTDYTVFNWKEAPKVRWIQEPVIKVINDEKKMEFSFSLIGMEQKQNENVKVKIQRDTSKTDVIDPQSDGIYRFSKKLSEINSTESEISELYKISILTHGKTDIKGESQPKFVMNYKGENISSTQDVFNDIKVKINSKIRELSSVFAQYKKYEKIIDKYQIRLSSENYEIVLYLTDLEIDQSGSNNDYTNYKLKEYSIPSNTYKISYKVFLKNGQISDEFDVPEYNFDFNNDIICKPTFESITGDDCSQSPDNQNVNLPTQMENDKCYFKIYPNVPNIKDAKEKIQLFRYDFILRNNNEPFEIVQKNKQYSESFLIDENDKKSQQSSNENVSNEKDTNANYSYKYYFQGNKVPDGVYSLELKNKRKYLNYYNYCESQPSSPYVFDYVYPVPTITKQSFVITPKISYSPTTKKQSISIVGNYAFESNDALDGMTLSIGEGVNVYSLQVVKMVGSVVLNNYYDSDSNEKVKLTFSAFRHGDDWKRTGSAEAISGQSPIAFSELKDIIKTNGQHHHSFNAEEEFNWLGASVGNENQKWNSIKRDTVYNIKKNKKYTIDNKDYFTHKDYEKAFDDNKLFVFKVNQYISTNGEIVRRFQPTTISVSGTNSTSETDLINLKLKQDIDVDSVYNKSTDKCDVTINFKLNETLTKQKLKYFRIKFKEKDNESGKQYQYDLLNENLSINEDTFSNTVSLPMGSYDVSVFGDSQVSATETNDQNELMYGKTNDGEEEGTNEGETESTQSKPSPQQIYISDDENELEKMVQVTTAQRVDGSSKIVLGWKLNHKLCQSVWLCYKTGSQNDYKKVNGRSYNRYTINTNESLDYYFEITSKFISPGGSTGVTKTIAKGSISKKQ